MLQAVCNRLGIDTGDRLCPDSKKRKFLVTKIPDDAAVRFLRRFAHAHIVVHLTNRQLGTLLKTCSILLGTKDFLHNVFGRHFVTYRCCTLCSMLMVCLVLVGCMLVVSRSL